MCALTFQDVNNYPKKLNVIENEKQVILLRFPFKVDDRQIDPSVLNIDATDGIYSINPVNIGRTDLQLKLFGLLPIKNIEVNVVPRTKVFPGGQSIGVKLNTKGVLVVGLEEFESVEGKKSNPGVKAGLSIGDSILEINSTKVKDANHVIWLINQSKSEEVILTIKRKEEIFKTKVIPEKSKADGEYRMGLWVRDKTAGVGTLTFYHPESMKFGALGHAITDIDTGLLLTVGDGEVVRSKVASVQLGTRGKPGEIKGIFYETNKPIGSLEKNTQYGIYGVAYEPIENSLYKAPIEIGYQNQIKEGKAQILTTINEDKMEAYDIVIEKVNRQRTVSTKSMVIRIVDKRLLDKTGGIVQGMSGSPIIQNGKLIGAVTHVFVNDPTKGYGLFIEWMLQEANIDIYNQSKLATND